MAPRKLRLILDMRRLVLILTLALAASSARAEAGKAAPGCDPTRIGAKELADCLRTASEKSDRDLAAALSAALKAIDAQPRMLSNRKTRWKRFLNDSQTQWQSWRDEECQDLAPLETPGAGDPRLSCLIVRNTLRAADLRARYP
jgi:uncharacterized protein YecT (DUF1311 family)